MMDTKKREDTLIDIGKKFSEFSEFLEESDQSNPSEPYEKKYQAINMLKEMKAQLDDITTNLTESNREIIMLAIVCLNMGILYTHVEETKNAEQYFMESIELLTGRELQPDAIIPVISTLNQLGIIWAQWSQATKAKGFLDTAEELYINFTTNIQLDPISIEIVMGTVDGKLKTDAKNILKKLHTLTLYYLAQVYEALEDKDKFAAYCHKTLSLQLSQNKELHDLDYVDWALNAATLSQYFVEHDCFTQARYHLNAASYILEQYENSMLLKNAKEMSDSIASELENYNHRSADVARCWSKYGVTLLNVSKERLLKKVEQEDESSLNETNLTTTVEGVKPAEDLKFVDLEIDLSTINQVTDKYLLDFNDARSVFLNVQKWLNQAKTYYTLDGHASDYAHIAQDMSQAYKYLAFFEECEARQAKMHKRRINILEEIVNELNPQYYRTICREMWIELGETYSDILQIKTDQLENTNDPTTHMITKINHLAQNSVRNFQLYLDSVKITKSDDEIKTIPDDQLFSVLYAYFHLGRLYNRIIASEVSLKIENTQRSIDAYKFVVDYYDKHPEKTEEIKKYGFINLCKEFVSLLPLKLHSLKNQLINE